MNLVAEGIDELLRRCTVRITAKNKNGTGFFVAQNQIITCAHVIEKRYKQPGEIKVWLSDGTEVTVTSVELKNESDLAMLTVNVKNDVWAYLNADVNHPDALLAVGTSKEFRQVVATVEYEGVAETASGHQWLRVKGGQIVPGFSGAPLLNKRTFSVCGVVKQTRDEDQSLGGNAISSAVVFREFPQLQEAQESEGGTCSSWAESLRQNLGAASPTVGAPRPLGVLLPPSIGTSYAERADRIAGVAAHFKNPVGVLGSSSSPLVLAGPPGIGKTRLAIEYAHQNKSVYQTVIKINADTANALRDNVLNLIRNPGLGISYDIRGNRSSFYEIVLAQLAVLARQGLLVILDNVDSPQAMSAVKQLLQSVGEAHVIITSQIRLWGVGCSLMEVRRLSPNGACKLLRNGLKATKNSLSECESLSETLGGLPLAIEIAIAYCENNCCSASQYSSVLAQSTEDVLKASGFEEVDYPLSVWAACAASWKKLDAECSWATTILTVSAYYGNAPIPIELWDRGETNSSPSELVENLVAAGVWKEVENEYGSLSTQKALAVLRKYCQVDFVEEDGLPCYLMPSLVRRILRTKYSSSRESLCVMIATPVSSLLRALSVDEQCPANWEWFFTLRPHVDSVLCDLTSVKCVWPTVLVAEKVGRWYSACGFNDQAIEILSQVVAIEMEAWGHASSDWVELAIFGVPDRPSMFVSHCCSFAMSSLVAGDDVSAISVLRAAEGVLSVVSLTVVASWYSLLGECLLSCGDFGGAESAMRAAVNAEESAALSGEKNALSMHFNRLASVHMAIQEYDKAEKAVRAAIHLDSQWRNSRYRKVVTGSSLVPGRRLDELCGADWKGSSDRDREVTFVRPRWLGKSYGKFIPELGRDLFTFAKLRVAQGRLSEASLLLDGAMAITWYTLGPMARPLADMWVVRKSISGSGDASLSDTYPHWVLGICVLEVLASTGQSKSSSSFSAEC